jgi:hypothetical protein
MGSATRGAAGNLNNPWSDDDGEVAAEAKLLLDKHGQQAESVAAHRADAAFQCGDSVRGNWWLKVFRRIAFSHVEHARGQN